MRHPTLVKKPIRTTAERLIVAADFKPESPHGARRRVEKRVLELADSLEGTGVYLKVNSALRACSYGLIDEIQARDLRVFADLKLVDIKETLGIDGMLLDEAEPDLVTVMCNAGVGAMRVVAEELAETEVLGVTVLTSLTEEDVLSMYSCSIGEAVVRLADMADTAGIHGLISAPTEVPILRGVFEDRFSLNTAGVRPTWAIVAGDDQNPDRIMTPAKAIKTGADRIVVGRPITQAKPNNDGFPQSPREAVERTLREIEEALDSQ